MSSKKILFNSHSCPMFVSYGNATSTEAAAFITATGITDSTQISAIRELVNNLIGYGLWSKMKAIYPFVGGTATTHKYNLKDPQDTDAAFRIIFYGSWVHNSNGINPNGTNTYADTNLIVSSNLSQNDTHLSYYSRTNSSGTYVEIAAEPTTNKRISLHVSYSGQIISDSYNYSTGRISYANPNSTGLYIGSRISATDHKIYKNGFMVGLKNTGASGSIADVSAPVIIGALKTGATIANFFTNRVCSLASIGSGLSKCDAYYLYKMVQLYQTTLGRQV